MNTPPDGVVRLGLWVRRIIQRFADAITPPELVLFEHMSGVLRTQLIGQAARLDLAGLLAAGPRSATEIAARAGTHPDATFRVLRGLEALGVVRRDAEGDFVGTRLLAGLDRARPTASRDFAMYWASRSNVAAWSDLGATLESGRGAFPRVHGRSVWEWFDAHPEERETFARAMGGLTTVVAPIVARSYPWEEVSRVCDVGGGRGMLLSEVLRAHPHLRGVLCDAEGVVASAAELLEARGVADRVERAPGSFFTEVPAGCDAYLLKNILHDWDDASCARVLAVVRGAMAPGARVVIVEVLLEPDVEDRLATFSDLQMMVVCDDGRERSRQDYVRLLEQTGFRPGRLWRHALASVIEGVAV